MGRANVFHTAILSLSTLISSAYALDFETNPETQEIRKRQAMANTVSASMSSNLYNKSSADYKLDSDLAIDSSLNIEHGPTLLGHISLYKDLRGERKQQLNDAYIGATMSVWSAPGHSVSLLGLGFIPLSENSRKNQYLDTGIMIAPTYALNLTQWGVEGLRISLRPSFRQNFHRYKTAMDGSSNTKNTVGVNLTLAYQLQAWTLISRNTYNKSQTYRGNTRDAYRLEQAVSYQFHPRSSVTVGHLNGGNPLAPNGVDTDIRVFNRRESQVYTSISYTF
jgi:hypothetical protein